MGHLSAWQRVLFEKETTSTASEGIQKAELISGEVETKPFSAKTI